MKEGYKDTPIGMIPVDWDVVKLGVLGSFAKGKGISKSELSESGIPCIRYGEIYTVHDTIIKKFHSFIDSEIAKQSYRIKQNDILFAGSGETVEDIGKA
jgi:type I restriction enzyme S subunit